MPAFPSTHSGGAARRAERLGHTAPAGQSSPSKQPFWKLLPDVWVLIKPRRGILAVGFVLMMINRVSGFVAPLSLKYLFDDVIGKHQVHLPQWYMEKKLSKPGIGLGFFGREAFDEYVRCFTWKTIRGSCEDYRACATCDLEMDTADKDRKVTCPLLVIWGARSHTGTVHGDVLGVWRGFGEDVVGGPIDCGHYVPEEAPEETYRWFVGFFGGRAV